MNGLSRIVSGVLLMFWICSCCKEPIFPDPDEGRISLSENEVYLSVKEQYHTISVKVEKILGEIVVSSDCGWIRPMSQTLPEDGYFEFHVKEDEEDIERRGHLTFTGINENGQKISVQCIIIQGRDSGDNDDLSVANTMRVGYGYDIFGVFRSDVSVKDKHPIINKKLLLAEKDEYGLFESSLHSDLRMEKISSRSLDEMAYILTEREEKTKTGIRGASKTVSIHSTSKYEINEQQFAHISLLKTVAMRSLDLGIFTYLVENGEDIFSPEFKEVRQQVMDNPSTENIEKMLDEFGTHLVVYAELGASIELSINFSRTLTGSLTLRTEDYADYFLRNKSSDFLLSDGTIADLTCSVSPNSNCIISGGAKDKRDALAEEIQKNGRPSASALNQWIESTNGDVMENLKPIHFQLVPIWRLFPVEYMSVILKEVNNLSSRSSNHYSPTDIGTDYYKIELDDYMYYAWSHLNKEQHPLEFDDSSEATLVKTLSVSDDFSDIFTPILEICNEYVPAIRGDKRISVVYALKNGMPFHGAGFFPGDGEGNPPAWLTFSGSDVYVRPVIGCDRNDIITTIYYLHGNIYIQDYGTAAEAPLITTVKGHFLELDKKYPIVKIGSGYWTRQNISENLYFGKNGIDSDNEPYFISQEYKNKNGMLYANMFYENGPKSFEGDRKWWFGTDEHEIYGERTKWYLPKIRDIRNLQSYVGNNTRELLLKQNTGFDATFDGFYGAWDILSVKSFNTFGYHYQSEYCFLPCKDEYRSKTGEVLALSSNYTLTRVQHLKGTDSNAYPIRLYRTPYWKYPDYLHRPLEEVERWLFK